MFFLQLATFWLIRKFDLFHAVSGQMVAVRDVHTFDNPTAAAAAGITQQKYLDYALAAGAEEAEKLARTSGPSSNLGRMSQVRFVFFFLFLLHVFAPFLSSVLLRRALSFFLLPMVDRVVWDRDCWLLIDCVRAGFRN